jgi:hypothetical protein
MNQAGTTFIHPNPRFERIVQTILLLVTLALVLAVLAQIVLVIAGLPLLLALLIAITTISLIPFTLLPTIAAPTVTLSAERITLQPHFLPAHAVRWADVAAVKPYPLTPSPGSENTRRLMVGRLKYTPMQGIMLLIPSLPWLYRVHGLLTHEGWVGVVALTNRSHADYDRLVALVAEYTGKPIEPITEPLRS